MAQEARAGSEPAADVMAGLGRAFAGALIFGLPMLMTMEMWEFGASMDRWRLTALIVLALPLLVGIAHRIGFEATFGWREDVRDAFLALGVAILTSALVLAALGLLPPAEARGALLGRIAVQSVPAAIGALLARSQLGGGATDDAAPGEADEGASSGDAGENEGTASAPTDPDGPSPGGTAEERALGGWAGAMFLMLVGAIFLSLNVAATEEMVLISYVMTPWHGLVLVALSLVIIDAFVYAVGFGGEDGVGGGKDAPGWSRFLRYTLTGYALCVLISVYMLWTFGRLDALAIVPAMMAVIVLAFPAAVGAAAARLLL